MTPIVTSMSRYAFAAHAARDLASSLPSPLVYDVGAGEEEMRVPIEAMGLEWAGFDLAPRSDRVACWNIEHACPKGEPAAGLILMLDVIEHLLNPGICLDQIQRVLLPEGYLVLTTPNPRWSRSRVEALRTGFLTCFTQADLDGNGHVFPVWPHVLMQALASRGFSVNQYVTLDGRTAWPPLTRRYPLRLAHAALCRWIEAHDPSACGMSYALVARNSRVESSLIGAKPGGSES